MGALCEGRAGAEGRTCGAALLKKAAPGVGLFGFAGVMCEEEKPLPVVAVGRFDMKRCEGGLCVLLETIDPPKREELSARSGGGEAEVISGRACGYW